MSDTPKKRVTPGLVLGLIGAAIPVIGFIWFLAILRIDVNNLQSGEELERIKITIINEIEKVGAAQLASLGSIEVPPGTVMAFAGDASHIPDGWLLCDGEAYDGNLEEYKKLYGAIDTTYGRTVQKDKWFNVPDYRGLFLRGVDDPDGNGPRAPAGNDANPADRVRVDGTTGGVVGSVQQSATARPTKDFITGPPSTEHKHNIPTGKEPGGEEKYARGAEKTGTRWTDFGGGAHNHTVTEGGDDETRPVNVYVNWIIKL